MRWPEEALTTAYGELAAQDASTGTNPCPDEGILEAFLLGEIETGDREKLADHLEVCSSCASLVQELGSLAEWSDRAAAVPDRSWKTNGMRRWAALAATLLLAVLGVTWWSFSGPEVPGSDPFRATGGQANGMTPAMGSVLGQAPKTYDWPDQPGAEAYRLTILGPIGEALWTSGWLETSQCDLPEVARAQLASAGSFAWTVAVKGSVPRTELGPYTFRIAPQDPS